MQIVNILDLLTHHGLNLKDNNQDILLLNRVFEKGLGNVFQWYVGKFGNPFHPDLNSRFFRTYSLNCVLWSYTPLWLRWYIWTPNVNYPDFEQKRLFDPNNDVLNLNEQNAVNLFLQYLRLFPDLYNSDEILLYWIESFSSNNPNHLNKKFWADMVRREIRAREAKALIESITIPYKIGVDIPRSIRKDVFFDRLVNEPIMTHKEIEDLNEWRKQSE